MKSGAKKRNWGRWLRVGDAVGNGPWDEEGWPEPFPRAWHLGLLTGVASFALYLSGMSWKASSPTGTGYLVKHLGLDGSVPLTDLAWGLLVRLGWRFPPPAMDTSMALASAVFGALAVGLLTALMVRVRYPHPGFHADTTPMREAVARRISGVTAGLFLALSAPHWWASTRAMPTTMWLAVYLAIAWLFSWWQNSGKKRALFVWSFSWGAGMAANGSLWLTAPLGLLLWGRELARWHAWKDWRSYALFFGGVGLGLSTLAGWWWWAWHVGGWQLYDSKWALLPAMLKAQAQVFAAGRSGPAALLFLSVTGVPWWLLFVWSCRAPWFYERGQIALHLLLAALLLAVLHNWLVAPWKIFGGLLDPMLAPTALNAACMGYLAGEFWILGERKVLADAGRKKFIRGVAAAAAWAVPAAVLAVLPQNADLVLADRKGDGIWEAACGILDSRGERDILFAAPPFDDALLLAVEERREPVLVVRGAGRASKAYLEWQAETFPMEAVRGACAEGSWEGMFPLWSTFPGGLERTIVVPGVETVREWAHPMPVGYAWHLEPLAEATPPETTLQRQRPVWQQQAEWLKRDLDTMGPAYIFRSSMCGVSARNLNDLGVEFAEKGDVRTAARLWRLAMKFQPTHLAAAMNLEMAKQTLRGKMPAGTDADGLPGNLADEEKTIAWLGKCEEWLVTQASTPKRQLATHWAISLRYGLVWRAEDWMKAGYPWAGSGRAPAAGNPYVRSESHLLVGLFGANPLERWIDTVCLRVGQPVIKPEYLYAALCSRPGNHDLLAVLTWHYLRRGEWEFAAAHIREAERTATPGSALPLRFEHVLTDALRAGWVPHSTPPGKGKEKEFLWPELWVPEGVADRGRAEPYGLKEAMLATARAEPTDPRPWMVLWMQGVDGADRWYAERMLTEKGLTDEHVGLSMVFGALLKDDVGLAKKELFQCMAQAEKNPIFWRLLFDIATAEGNQKLARGAERRLRTLIPELQRSSGGKAD